MVGKMVLPSLGGAASVWTTCVLFFQSMLLAGYLYAYFLGRFFSRRRQILFHLAVMLAAFVFLPIRFDGSNLPGGGANPIVWELLQLLRSVALPFFVVSTTAPLLQNWLAATDDPAARDPYFLYAASNAGSLLSLMLYPFVFEPRLGVLAQSQWWTAGYALLVGFVAVSAAVLWRSNTRQADVGVEKAPTAATRAFWLGAAFVPSALMLAVTTHLSVNLATVPFLWTLPLAVYLLTFILAFGRRIRVSADGISRVAPALLLLLIPIFTAGTVRETVLYLGLLLLHLLLLFAGGLLCHTALADRRPGPSRLTEYYAWIAFGGALGGIFAAIVAPLSFNTVLEYPLLAATLAFFRKPQELRRNRWDWSFPILVGVLLAAGWGVAQWIGFEDDLIERSDVIVGYVVFALVAFAFHRRRWWFASGLAASILFYVFVVAPSLERGDRLYTARDFFGVKKVTFEEQGNHRKLLHGDTMHGLEGLDPERAGKPLSYYYPSGPLGDVMTMMTEGPDQHFGVVGLGSGTIAAYAQPNRRITFFEIDPQLEFIARRYFSFLPNCGRQCDVVLGDGRLSIQQAPDGEFDLLILDAFNSDAIPAHLLSREALEIYRRKLKGNGAILFHVSNRYLRVRALVSALVIEAGMPALVRSDDDDSEPGKARSVYVIAALDEATLQPLYRNPYWREVSLTEGIEPWTDDYSNLWALLRW